MKLVWSEVRVEGGRLLDGPLPKPPSATGPFQNIRNGAQPEYCADSAVVAYRVPDGDLALAELQLKVTSSGCPADCSARCGSCVWKRRLNRAQEDNDPSPRMKNGDRLSRLSPFPLPEKGAG